MRRSIFSFAVSICSGLPLSLICVPLDSIFKRGNFFLRRSSLPLLTPKNSMGLMVSRLMIVSVNVDRVLFFNLVGKAKCLLIQHLFFVSNINYCLSIIVKLLMHRLWKENRLLTFVFSVFLLLAVHLPSCNYFKVDQSGC